MLSPAGRDDERLVADYRAGDEQAFDRIVARYRPGMLRYARKVLGRRQSVTEDLVQEAFLRASMALRRDTADVHLRAWLYTILRNCCLDEIGRTVPPIDELSSLEDRLAGAERDVADQVIGRQELRGVLEDVSQLPPLQKHARVRRERDGISHRALAVELGVSEPATRQLVLRARAALVRGRTARHADCEEICADLLAASVAGHRASAHSHRHLLVCASCRDYRAQLRLTRRALALLSPLPVAFTVLGLKLTAAGLTGKATAAKTVATAGVCCAAGGAAVTPIHFGAGDPAPQRIDSVLLSPGTIGAGDPLPRGTALVQQRIRLHRRSGASTVRMPCPSGMVAGDLLAPRGPRATIAYAPSARPRKDRSVTVLVDSDRKKTAGTLTVRALCVDGRSAP